ncbi:MAG: hypothetical protein IH618_14385 [Ignavibacteriaceae bacterium]|nr:hypothetical protein [Ignavibacteriaceae bacterium]
MLSEPACPVGRAKSASGGEDGRLVRRPVRRNCSVGGSPSEDGWLMEDESGNDQLKLEILIE